MFVKLCIFIKSWIVNLVIFYSIYLMDHKLCSSDKLNIQYNKLYFNK